MAAPEAPTSPSAPTSPAPTSDEVPTPRRRRWPRRVAYSVIAVVGVVMLAIGATWVTLSVQGSGEPSAAAHGTGHDGEWLGHAWVDGRKTQADVDAYAAKLRTTGIRDLLVHAGPFSNDGTLDRGLRPKAAWAVDAWHAALPGVRVQAWLGANPNELDLGSSITRANMLTAIGQVLDDGFDGIHFDLEPVDSGDRDYVALLASAHDITRPRGAILSVAASNLAPSPVAGGLALLPNRAGVWSPGYLSKLAGEVDQVAVMAYDTWTWTPSMYAGMVRSMTSWALEAVPARVELLIGVPAYQEDNMRHRVNAETMANALRGVRLALGDHPTDRTFGVAVYVDFTATPEDWDAYQRGWHAPV
jgi:hypothetical protein